MSLSVFQRTIVNDEGTTLPAAQIDVYIAGTTTRPDLYSDEAGTTPITNPFNADVNGFAQFYVANGKYDVTANLGGSTATWDDVEIGRNLLTGFKNYIINGGFDIWQRGVSFSTAIGYTADRWHKNKANNIVEKIIKSDGRNALRFARNTEVTSYQTLSTVMELPKYKVDKQMVISGKIKFNVASPSAYMNITWAVGGSDNLVLADYGVDRTNISTEQIINIPITIEAGTDYSSYSIRFLGNAGTGTDEYDFEIAEMQLEDGRAATPFEQMDKALELVRCQRFLPYRSELDIYARHGSGKAQSATACSIIIPFKNNSRVKPTSLTYLGNIALWDGVALIAVTALVVSTNSTTEGAVFTVSVVGGLTATNDYTLMNNNDATAYIEIPTEL